MKNSIKIFSMIIVLTQIILSSETGSSSGFESSCDLDKEAIPVVSQKTTPNSVKENNHYQRVVPVSAEQFTSYAGNQDNHSGEHCLFDMKSQGHENVCFWLQENDEVKSGNLSKELSLKSNAEDKSVHHAGNHRIDHNASPIWSLLAGTSSNYYNVIKHFAGTNTNKKLVRKKLNLLKNIQSDCLETDLGTCEREDLVLQEMQHLFKN